MSEDYKKGYRDGFLDGFKAAKDNPYMTQPAVPETPMPKSCTECGKSFVDSMGRFVMMGYVCPNTKCPTKITVIGQSYAQTTIPV